MRIFLIALSWFAVGIVVLLAAFLVLSFITARAIARESEGWHESALELDGSDEQERNCHGPQES
jgi:hypothetical protein